MNPVLSRAPARRAGNRPGWTVMTALLILAIAASSALVFTSRVELLKLAVIIALWAAVAASFVSLIYRRQSDVDQARVRDLKLVYDLQLDREISARREYELTVESQLRRELATERRAQSSDELIELRAELAALRNNLEILFGNDLNHVPALEQERAPIRAYSDWARSGGDSASTGAGHRSASWETTALPPDFVDPAAENPIIDVPEVRIPAPASPPASNYQSASTHRPYPASPMSGADGRRGSHRRTADEQPRRDPHVAPPAPPPAGGHWSQPSAADQPRREPEPVQRPPQVSQPASAAAPEPAWRPLDSGEAGWFSPAASGWTSEVPDSYGWPNVPEGNAEVPGRHGRAAARATHAPDPLTGTEYSEPTAQRARSRHSAESDVASTFSAAEPPRSAPSHAAPSHAAPSGSRHSADVDVDADADTELPSAGGQSVAELMARLQGGSTKGGRRRRDP